MDSTDGDAILGGRLDGLTDEPGDEAENGWDMDVEYAGCQSDIWTVFVPRRSEQKVRWRLELQPHTHTHTDSHTLTHASHTLMPHTEHVGHGVAR